MNLYFVLEAVEKPQVCGVHYSSAARLLPSGDGPTEEEVKKRHLRYLHPLRLRGPRGVRSIVPSDVLPELYRVRNWLPIQSGK